MSKVTPLPPFVRAIFDEGGCYGGGTIIFDAKGVLPSWDDASDSEESAEDYFKRKAKARIAELAAQARQIIADKKVPRTGEIEYRFTADGAIRTLLVDEALRKQLASGALVIARQGDRYELLPRTAGDKVRERDASLVVLDHGQAAGNEAAVSTSEDDAYYAQFQVPDDLVW